MWPKGQNLGFLQIYHPGLPPLPGVLREEAGGAVPKEGVNRRGFCRGPRVGWQIQVKLCYPATCKIILIQEKKNFENFPYK
jgi:hypothetical protein